MDPTSPASVKKSGDARVSRGFLEGPASRRRLLRVLFVHSNAADVRQCVQELEKAHLKFSEDLISTPNQFAKRLASKPYDVLLVELIPPRVLAGMSLRLCCPRQDGRRLAWWRGESVTASRTTAENRNCRSASALLSIRETAKRLTNSWERQTQHCTR